MPGSVCASPSKIDPDYFYHWVRDSALVMKYIQSELDKESKKIGNPYEKIKLERMMGNYLDFSKYISKNQHPEAKLGEPKYNMDGSLFTDEWGRPQNDGPALRAISMIKYAQYLLEKKENKFERQKSIAHIFCNNCIINNDLEYVINNFGKQGFEIWEEVKGVHFYTSLAQVRALELGSKLAASIDDFEYANKYSSAVKKFSNFTNNFWNSKEGYIKSTIDWTGGLPDKYKDLDSQVILALIHIWDDPQTYIGPQLLSRVSFLFIYS
ncbi:Glucoamylase GLU1 [Smittium culicis]|uniref:glucan 1,4-alpha-glucosidase n=1 Tax=Smittium culicis TaxID=133412 RepID=A0A1R1YRN9_9FUNG|nr:Glucoamylase GLU1 [Smittium culicis]